jgi:hypothetical protein
METNEGKCPKCEPLEMQKLANKMIIKAINHDGIRIALCCYCGKNRRDMFNFFCDYFLKTMSMVIINESNYKIIIRNSVIYLLTPNSNFMGMEFDYAENDYIMPQEFKTRIRPRKGMI